MALLSKVTMLMVFIKVQIETRACVYIRLLASCPMGTPPKRIAGRCRLANMCLVEFLSAAHFFKLNKSLIQ